MKRTLTVASIFTSMIFCWPPVLAGVISANGGDGGRGGAINIRGAFINSTINLHADGGVGRDGGNLAFQDKDEEFQHIQGTWTFRALDDCCLQYPEYLTSLNPNKTRLLVSKIDNVPSAPSNQPDLNDWYSSFRETLINNFHPVARGAVGARFKIHKGDVESIEFFGFNSNIPFTKDKAAPVAAPTGLPASNAKELPAKESAFKANVSETIAKTAHSLAPKFPADAQDVELKIIFAGDAQGKGFWWTSWYLIDKANYPSAMSEK